MDMKQIFLPAWVAVYVYSPAWKCPRHHETECRIKIYDQSRLNEMVQRICDSPSNDDRIKLIQ